MSFSFVRQALRSRTLGPLLSAFLGAGVCIELGFRLGKVRYEVVQGVEAALSSALAAHLALLGFVLAFTFGLAATRLGERKFLIIDEANAIGTAGLRASVLPEPHASELRRILTEYTELRLSVSAGEVSFPEVAARNDALTAALWKETRLAVLAGKPNEPFLAIFAESVNELIDTGAKRVAVVYTHRVPQLYWVVLAVIGALCMAMLGFQSGMVEGHRTWVAMPLAASFALMVMLIVEMDTPGGLVRLNQEPMIQALRALREPTSRE